LKLSILIKSLFLCVFLPIYFIRPVAVQATDQDTIDPQGLENFLDGFLLSQLESHRVAGAVVSVVKDGEILFFNGYGYSDVEARTPALADQTLFRTGSVAKVVVWTAVMQLVERGQLDMNADIQIYLDFSIPDTYPEPITMANLLTHTAGFEEAGLGTFVLERDQMMPLGDYLRQNVPARIFPPGQIAAYSNYGAALAGYIVERISGMPYEEYINENIFQPLGMDNSTFYQPLPSDLAGQLSKGYLREGGRFREGRFEYVQAAPAGALSSTADDMAKFMIAHLQSGRFSDVQILKETTAQEMHAQQFSHHPDVNGMTYGWFESDFNGVRGINHGGNTVFFHTIMLLLPDQNLGLYASYNSQGGAEASFRLMYAFLERYFPSETTELAAYPTSDEGLGRFTGSFYPTRHNVSDFEKILLLAQPIQVSETEGGLLRVSGFGVEPWYWQQVGDFIFQNIETPQRLVFDQGETGRIDRFYISDFPPVAFLRTPWHASPSVHYLLLGITLPVFILTLIALPVAFLSTRSSRREMGVVNPFPARIAAFTSWLFSLIALVFAAGLLVLLMNPEIILGLPPWGEMLLLLAWALFGMALVMFILGVLAWIRGYSGIGSRILYTLVILSAFAYVFFLVYWNIL
jgi:CubicO group peptidase (beta-lactamase class C family)